MYQIKYIDNIIAYIINIRGLILEIVNINILIIVYIYIIYFVYIYNNNNSKKEISLQTNM